MSQEDFTLSCSDVCGIFLTRIRKILGNSALNIKYATVSDGVNNYMEIRSGNPILNNICTVDGYTILCIKLFGYHDPGEPSFASLASIKFTVEGRRTEFVIEGKKSDIIRNLNKFIKSKVGTQRETGAQTSNGGLKEPGTSRAGGHSDLSSDTYSANTVVDTRDIFNLFVHFMRNRLSNQSLAFEFTFGLYQARECRVVRLTDHVLAQIRIGEFEDVRFVRLCAGENVFGISTLRPGSVHFFTSNDVEVWSVEGDGSVLLRELGVLIVSKVC